MGRQWKQCQTLFWGAPKITADRDCSHEMKRGLLLGRKVMTNLGSLLKSRNITFVNKGPSSQGYGFSSSHVWIWELDYKESWALKNWCSWTVVLEKTLESPLNCKEIQPVHPKGDQSLVFIGRTAVEAETLILGSPDVKSWLIWKDPDAGKDWGQEEKGMKEDEMVGWHHRLHGHGFRWTLGVVMYREACHAAVHGVAKSRTWLSDWTELKTFKMILSEWSIMFLCVFMGCTCVCMCVYICIYVYMCVSIYTFFKKKFKDYVFLVFWYFFFPEIWWIISFISCERWRSDLTLPVYFLRCLLWEISGDCALFFIILQFEGKGKTDMNSEK